MAGEEKINISYDVSPQFYLTLSDLAEKIDGDTADVLRKGVALMQVALEAKEQGKTIWIADKRHRLEAEIVGI